METVEGVTTADYIVHLLRFPADPFILVPPPFRKPLCPHNTSSHSQNKIPSFACVFAATILQQMFVAQRAGLSSQEIQEFSVWICGEFFKRTADLLKKARNPKMNNMKEIWDTLKENLSIIYVLTAYRSALSRLPGRSRMVFTSGLTGKVSKLLRSDKGIRVLRLNVLDDCGETNLSRKEVRWGGKKDARIDTRIFGFELDSLFGNLGVTKREGWDHLQEYTQHWLDKLGKDSNRYGQVAVQSLNCCGEDPSGRKDREVMPPDDSPVDVPVLTSLTATYIIFRQPPELRDFVRNQTFH